MPDMLEDLPQLSFMARCSFLKGIVWHFGEYARLSLKGCLLLLVPKNVELFLNMSTIFIDINMSINGSHFVSAGSESQKRTRNDL